MSRSPIEYIERLAPIDPGTEQVVGRRIIGVIEDELGHLQTPMTHQNRSVGFDHVIVTHLLAFLNPAMKRPRKIDVTLDIPAVRNQIKLPRVPNCTPADA